MPFIIIIAYIFIEIALFAGIGGGIGVLPTLLWVIAGFVIGGAMMRRGGDKSRIWLEKARAGSVESGIGDQIFWFIGGLLVIIPGFFTDIMGFLLVLSPFRSLMMWLIERAMPTTMRESFAHARSGFGAASDDIVEGEVVDPDQPNEDLKRLY